LASRNRVALTSPEHAHQPISDTPAAVAADWPADTWSKNQVGSSVGDAREHRCLVVKKLVA
jgi:hypothetical protein